MASLSSLKDEYPDFAELRIFNGKKIQPEDPKPPVIASKDVKLTKDEISILSRGPKFALRNILSKERFRAEYEKGLVKKKYDDIGKEKDENGRAVDELPADDDEARCQKESKWI